MNYNPDKHHRRSIRLKGYDYTQEGAYYFTICCHQKRYLLGEIKDGVMHLNLVGATVKAVWESLPLHFPLIELDEFVIMPNHIHGIIIITNHPNNPNPTNNPNNNNNPNNKCRGEAFVPGCNETQPKSSFTNASPFPGYNETSPIPGYNDTSPIPGYNDTSPIPGYNDTQPKSSFTNASPIPECNDTQPKSSFTNASPIPGCNETSPKSSFTNASPIPGCNETSSIPGYNDTAIPRGTQSGSIGAILQNFKSVSTRRVNRITRNSGTLWQRNYHEEIIRNEKAYENIRRYIVENPLSWDEDEENIFKFKPEY